MDTVYGTKKYFQSLSGGSDIYRSSTARAMTNDYSTYQNTLGRRSTVAPYQHMNKLPSYSTDMSLSSQYGYNTWGLWRDQRNISPSVYSTKSRSSAKSFSIILTTAAFIVVLAVLSIAGLAFYFSTFKSAMEDPIMGFEGSFRIVKGDLFTTGLKYSHTSIYKQKVEFYKRFVEKALVGNGLHPTKCDIMGFGDGPLIQVQFRTLLDMRQVPQNIHSVEEHIRDSLYMETESLKSSYKTLRIESDTVEVKRIMDEGYIKSASFIRDSGAPTSQTNFEERLNKNSGIIEKTQLKTLPTTTTTTPKPKSKDVIHEPDIDVENAPVIQGSFEGSFEITKTDADITQKRTSPTKTYPSTSRATSVTAPPMRVKTKKTTIEKIKPPTKIYVTPTQRTTTQKTTVETTTSSTTSTEHEALETTITEKSRQPDVVSSSTEAIRVTAKPTESSEPSVAPSSGGSVPSDEHLKFSNVQDPPKLDVTLFTSAPVLDTEPWRPIRPLGASAIKVVPSPENLSNQASYTIPSLTHFDAVETGLLPRHKINFAEQATESPNEMIFYQSFTNPVFMPAASGIERLGATDVKPHPLPVPLIDEVVIPILNGFAKPTPQGEHVSDEQTEVASDFEHIGGGVIVKHHNKDDGTSSELVKADNSSQSSAAAPIDKSEPQPTTEHSVPPSPVEVDQTEANEDSLSAELGELLHSLLDIPTVHNSSENLTLESRVEEDDSVKPSINFLNIREHILNKNKTQENQKNSEEVKSEKNPPTDTTRTPTKVSLLNTTLPLQVLNSTPKPTQSSTPTPKSTIAPTRRPPTTKTTPATIDQSMLFPSHSKWEYVNGSSSHHSNPNANMKKVFNDTLQAWVVENMERPDDPPLKGLKVRKNNTEDIQDISHIFDTLASKLGISPSIPTKVPPFVAFSQNKRKHSQVVRNETIRRTSPRTSVSTTTTPTPPVASSSEEPILLQPLDGLSSVDNNSPEIIIGEAEVEVVDPTKYEEMLSSQAPTQGSSTRAPPLVTLLPVRSNSGIRTFRPPIKSSESRKFGQSPRYREAVVKTGIQVTA